MKHFPARILAVAPYSGMQAAMERVAQDYPNIQLDIFTGDLEDGVSIVRSHIREDYDCIISRGGTAQLIRTSTDIDIPVVEIPLSVYDMLRSMRLAENYTREYAIVGFPSITKVAHVLCSLLGKQVGIHTVQDADETQALLVRLQRDNCRTIIGDMVTHAIAQNMGMNAFLITSGPESLHEAIDQAITISAGSRRLRQENLFYRHMLRGQRENFIAMDEGGAVFLADPNELRSDFLEVFRNKLPAIPPHGVLKSYHDFNGRLFDISAQWLHMGAKQYALFQYHVTRIPYHNKRHGIYFYNRQECEYLFHSSLYSISGVLGELDTTVQSVAITRQPVVVLGEPGTDKDQIARLLYLRSKLCTNTFVVVDCASPVDKIWDFLLNHHNSPLNDIDNTIYFRCFDQLSAGQADELLAFLQMSDIDTRQRLIFSCSYAAEETASPRLLQALQQVGAFLLTLPPLRYRADEIVSLASLYLGRLNLELGKQISGFDSDALQQLRRFSWPGNYTQFQRILRELATLSDSYYIHSNAVAEILNRERGITTSRSLTPYSFGAEQTLDEIIHLAIGHALAAHGGNQTAAARQLGISRSTLWRYTRDSGSGH